MLEMLRWIRSISYYLNRIVEVFICIIGMVMAVVMAVQVFYRYVLNHSLFWSEEFGRICLVWLSFLGATSAYKRGMHIGIDFLVSKFSSKLQSTIKMVTVMLSIIFFLILVIFGFNFVTFVSYQKTAAIGLPMSIPYFIIPVCGVIFVIHALDMLLELVLDKLCQKKKQGNF